MNNRLDQLNVTLSLDGWTAEHLESLAPHKSVFNLDKPRQVSRNLSIPKTVVSTIAAFIHDPYIECDLDKQKQMKMLLR